MGNRRPARAAAAKDGGRTSEDGREENPELSVDAKSEIRRLARRLVAGRIVPG